jgi:hypothetical protein
MFALWALVIDDEEKDTFTDRSDAVAAAAEELQLSVSEVAELSRNGWLPLGRLGSVRVFDKNDGDD